MHNMNYIGKEWYTIKKYILFRNSNNNLKFKRVCKQQPNDKLFMNKKYSKEVIL